MKLLLHICCAPCSIMCIQKLSEENIDIYGLGLKLQSIVLELLYILRPIPLKGLLV